VRSSLCVSDVDGDDQQEIIVGSCDDRVYCFNGLGVVEWTYTTYHNVYPSACVCDMDRDGWLEIITGSDDGRVYCLNGTGVLE